MVRDRALRTGDGSHPEYNHNNQHSHGNGHGHHSAPELDEHGEIQPTRIDGKEASWGWGDEAMAKEAETVTKLLKIAKCS